MMTSPMKDVTRVEFFTLVRQLIDDESIMENMVSGTNLSVVQYVRGDFVLAQAIYTKPMNLSGIKVVTDYQIRKDGKI
jgi:hypothetical protein